MKFAYITGDNKNESIANWEIYRPCYVFKNVLNAINSLAYHGYAMREVTVNSASLYETN